MRHQAGVAACCLVHLYAAAAVRIRLLGPSADAPANISHNASRNASRNASCNASRNESRNASHNASRNASRNLSGRALITEGDALGSFTALSRALLLSADRTLHIQEVSHHLNVLSSYFGGVGGANVTTKVAPFLIISQQRSGTGMFRTLLDSHPSILSINAHILETTRGATLSGAFGRLQKDVRLKMRDCVGGRFRLGLSMQSTHVFSNTNVSASDRVQVVFHWRRNALRQLISVAANAVDKVKRSMGMHIAHPLTDKDAQGIAEASRPVIPTHRLEKDIADIVGDRCEIMKHVSKLKIHWCVSHYEDWADEATRAAAAAGIEHCLGVERRNLTSPLRPIHGQHPINSTVKGWENVARSLHGTRFEYMLEAQPAKPLGTTDGFESSIC